MLVLLDHGQISSFHLLDCSDFEVIHLRVVDSESGIRAPEHSLIDLAHLLMVWNLDQVLNLLVPFD